MARLASGERCGRRAGSRQGRPEPGTARCRACVGRPARGAGPSAGAATVRDLSEQTNRSLDALHDARRRPRILGRDVTVDLGDVGERVVQPADLHPPLARLEGPGRLGVLASGERVEIVRGVLVAHERAARVGLPDRLADLLDLPRRTRLARPGSGRAGAGLRSRSRRCCPCCRRRAARAGLRCR